MYADSLVQVPLPLCRVHVRQHLFAFGVWGSVPRRARIKAHRLLYHSALGLRVIQKKKEEGTGPASSLSRPCPTAPFRVWGLGFTVYAWGDYGVYGPGVAGQRAR